MRSCTHGWTVDVAERCFSGALGDNRAAHGCVTVVVECGHCGARRSENRNGIHEEHGAWGPSRAERRARAEELRAHEGRPRRWTESDGTRIVVEHAPPGSRRSLLVTIDGDARTYDLRDIVVDPRCTPEVHATWDRIAREGRAILDAWQAADAELDT